MNEQRLVRSETDRMIAGVCSGLADYLNIDPALVRLAFILLLFASGIGLPIYLLLWVIMPSSGNLGEPNNKIMQENIEDLSQTVSSQVNRLGRSGTVGAIFILLGVYFLLEQTVGLGWLNAIFWPMLIMGLGAYLIINRRS